MQIIYSYFKSVLSDCVPSWTTPTWGLREQLLLILVSIYSRHVHIDYEWVQCWLWENNAKKLFCSDWRGKFCFFLNLNFYKWCLILKDKTLFWKKDFFFGFFLGRACPHQHIDCYDGRNTRRNAREAQRMDSSMGQNLFGCGAKFE